MKKIYFLFIASFIMSVSIYAQEVPQKEENKKLEIKPYGFIKGDMVYSNGGVKSFGNVNLSAPQLASGEDRDIIGFTAQHTRIGLKGSVGDKIKAGGLVEIDFYGGAFDANIKPRLRLAYASIIKGGFEARMGQQWDLFSPNNANTSNTNGNMWFAGNCGFRRTQLQLSYTMQNEKIAPMVQVSLGEATREESGLGKDNYSGKPMLQARLSGKILNKYIVGVSMVNATYLEQKGTIVGVDTLKKDFDFNTSAIGFDINLPIHKYFSLTGEINTGKNLNNANLFTIAGNQSYSLSNNGTTVTQKDKKSMGLWLNATSNITDWLNVVAGFGMDKNNSKTFAVGNIDKNTVLYFDLIFPIKHGFSFALEYQNINTSMVSAVDVNSKIDKTKAEKANVINLSAKITF